MDYEQKYKEALENAKGIINYYKEHNRGDEASIEDLEEIFPELKESEDERIRKALIFYLGDMPEDTELRNGVTNRDILAWLEKQGEQKNKINSCKITFEDVLALECAIKTIKIIEDSDELYKILIHLYNKIHNAYLVEKQCKQKVPINDFKAKNWYVSEVDGKIHDMTYNPADKVEPKKIEDEIEIPFGAKDSELQEATYYIPKGFHAEIDDDKVVIKKSEKPTWSEDDERIVTALMEGFRYHQLFNPRFGEVPNAEIISWIKSLKERLS